MQRKSKISKSLKKKSVEIINHGICCNCFVLLKELGILNHLLKGNSIEIEDLSDPNFCSNRPAAFSALITLEKSKIVEKKSSGFELTKQGFALAEYIGLITMLFDGYGRLMAEQKKIAHNELEEPFQLMKVDSIAEASIQFGKKTVDPLIKTLFSHLHVEGTICDLGCGLGTRLGWLCKEMGTRGLGFENDKITVDLATKKFKEEPLLTFELGDISNLKGKWENVSVLMQYFVFHDFVKSTACVPILNSYLKNFPNLKYFVYVDIVSPSISKEQIMPGYDYVHGLLGITTPTYEDTLDLFSKSDFEIAQEISVPDLPNTFIWLLTPKTKRASY